MRRKIATPGRTTVLLALAAASVAALTGSALALTPAQTRDGYVAQVEPICKRNTEANEKILAGVRGKIQRNKLQPAARQVGRAAGAFDKALRQLRAVQAPAGDAATVSRWLGKLERQGELLRAIQKALKEEKRSRVYNLQAQVLRNASAANRIVLGFDFDYCRLDGARFT